VPSFADSTTRWGFHLAKSWWALTEHIRQHGIQDPPSVSTATSGWARTRNLKRDPRTGSCSGALQVFLIGLFCVLGYPRCAGQRSIRSAARMAAARASRLPVRA
jgi:hypothetical protein